MKLLIAAASLLLVGAASTSQIDVQFLHGEKEPTGAILHTGVIEFKDQDGKKAYWITGKALKELVRQTEGHVEKLDEKPEAQIPAE